jgi:hypothetical protein
LRQEIEDAQALLGAAMRPALEVAHNGTRAVLALPADSVAGLGEAFAATALSIAACENGSGEVGCALREEGPRENGGAV